MKFTKVRLGEIAQFINGRAYKNTEFKESGTPIIRIQNLTGGGNTVYSDLELPENKYIDNGDLIYAWSATFGPYIWRGPKSIYHYHIWKVIPFENTDKFYLYYLLKHISDRISSQGTGSIFSHVTKGLMESFEVDVLPFDEQVKVGKVLQNLDNQIHINYQIIQTLESMAQAIFKSWFIDFDPVHAKIAAKQEGKDAELAAMCVISGKSEEELKQMAEDDFAELQATAALFPDELVESELGEVPKGWEYKKLKNLCRVINGRAYKNTEFKDKGIPIVRIQNLTGGGKTVFSDLDLPQDKLIEKEDFIYAWSATFGPYIWRGPKSIYHYHIWKMDVNETIISRYFLYLTMFRKTESMKSAGTGSIFTHLTKAIMESQDVLIADNAINMLFKDRIDKIFKLISLKSDEIKNLKNIRDNILPKLLSGEVDVTTLADTKNSSDKEQIA